MSVERQMGSVLESAKQQCRTHGVGWSDRLEAVFRNVVGSILLNMQVTEEELMGVRRELDALKQAEKVRCGQCGGKGHVPDHRSGKGIRICDFCAGSGER